MAGSNIFNSSWFAEDMNQFSTAGKRAWRPIFGLQGSLRSVCDTPIRFDAEVPATGIWCHEQRPRFSDPGGEMFSDPGREILVFEAQCHQVHSIGMSAIIPYHVKKPDNRLYSPQTRTSDHHQPLPRWVFEWCKGRSHRRLLVRPAWQGKPPVFSVE